MLLSAAGLDSKNGDFNLDIVWKAYTLTPYDYPGKALPSTFSQVLFYALADVPHPEKLTYTWIMDDSSSTRDGPELSGVGKDRFALVTFQIPEFTHQLRLIVRDENTGKSASTAVELNTVQPEADLYLENNNNFNSLAADTINFAPGANSSLMARLFYFNALSPDSLDFKWYLNDAAQDITSARKEIIPLNITDRIPAGSQVRQRLDITNPKTKNDVFQRASVKSNIFVTQ